MSTSIPLRRLSLESRLALAESLTVATVRLAATLAKVTREKPDAVEMTGDVLAGIREVIVMLRLAEEDGLAIERATVDDEAFDAKAGIAPAAGIEVPDLVGDMARAITRGQIAMYGRHEGEPKP